MTSPLFQCVPNLSEGRRPEVMQALADCVRTVPGVALVDHSSDPDHNRMVLTMIGPDDALERAVLQLYHEADRWLNVHQHQGAHPRIGAVDVVPFVPVWGATMEQAVALAHRVGRRVADELQVPVFFYAEAAQKADYRSLAWLRRGQLPGLQGDLEVERRPDAGPPVLHSRLGATAVGARRPLIAYNVVLDTADLTVAREVARRVRESSGGLKHLQAMGVLLEQRGRAQVSMNLLDPDRTSLYTAFEMVKMEARRFGVSVLDSEIVGLTPLEAVVEVARYYLQLPRLRSTQVLEAQLLSLHSRHRTPELVPPGPEGPGGKG
ncbi:MAG: glutamate formimidoyltransferase [Candidatus Eremiobacterota bacterium]